MHATLLDKSIYDETNKGTAAVATTTTNLARLDSHDTTKPN